MRRCRKNAATAIGRKIAIAQDLGAENKARKSGAEPKKKHGLLIAAIVLIVLGAAAVPTVQYVLNLKNKPFLFQQKKPLFLSIMKKP